MGRKAKLVVKQRLTSSTHNANSPRQCQERNHSLRDNGMCMEDFESHTCGQGYPNSCQQPNDPSNHSIRAARQPNQRSSRYLGR
jgi:hypothetical protein